MHKLFSLIFLPIVVFVVFGFDNFEVLKAHVEEWKGCHPGFQGMTQDQLYSARKCQDMLLSDSKCYLSCFLNETGITSGGMWDEAGAQENIGKMWDKDHNAERDKWYQDTKKCVDEFQGAGHTFPGNYAEDCSVLGGLKTCILESRKCK